MASAWAGQPALCQLPSAPDEKNEQKQATALESYVPPDCLWAAKRGDAETKKTGFGIVVYKVASTGKVHPRRLAISSDNRTILISSARFQSKIKSVKNLFKDKSSSQTDGGVSARRIDISSIESVQRGQQSRKFCLAKERASANPDGSSPQPGGSWDEADGLHSLSIVHRVASSAPHSGFDLPFASGSDAALSDGSSSNTLESLDLTVPSETDYEALIRTLEELLSRYKTYRSNVHRDVLLLQHCWIDMGKSLDKSISASDWSTICADGLGVPLQKPQLQSLYEKHCQDIGAEAGLKLPQAIRLLNIVREHTNFFKAGLSDVDPCTRVWKQITSIVAGGDKYASAEDIDAAGNPQDVPKALRAYENKIESEDDETITAEQFLSFLQDKQKDVSTSLDEVHDLFGRLNVQISPGQAALLRSDPDHVDGEENKRPSVPQDRITKSTFVQFLTSDANDIFDPSSGTAGKHDMSKPLSSYWINTSHKTYLTGNGSSTQDGVQAVLEALQRGCRCLELDIWDGQGMHSDSPVVRYGETTYTHDEKKSEVSVLGSVPLQDVLCVIRTFLQSRPRSYPIIISMENHCSVVYQDKVASQLQDILGSGDMLYKPPASLNTLRSLPSPESLRGKVVIKSKRPLHDGASAAIVDDDFDDENDFDPNLVAQPHAVEIDDDGVDGTVIGFGSIGSIISDSPHAVERTPQELLEIAEKEADDAKKVAETDEKRAFDLEVEANEVGKQANVLAAQAGFTYQDLEQQRIHFGSPQSPKLALSETSPSNDDGTTGTFSPVSVSVSASSGTTQSQDFDRLGSSTLGSGSIPSQDFNHLGSSTMGSGTLSGTVSPNALGSGTVSGTVSPNALGSGTLSSTVSPNALTLNGSGESEGQGWLGNLGRDFFPPTLFHNDTLSTQHTGYTDRTDETPAEPRNPKNEGKNEAKSESVKRNVESSPENSVDEDGGVEVQDFFFESVAQAEAGSANADEVAAKAGETALSALSNFQEVSQAFTAAEYTLYRAMEKKRDLAAAADRARAEARANQEHAETAKQRVVTVQQLRENCSNQAKSAETVAATAATEAEISEQRANEAEKRSARAQAAAKKDRETADIQTKKEEELGKEALRLQAKYEETSATYKRAKEISEKIAIKLGRIEDEVKMIEESPMFIKEYGVATEDHPEDEEIIVAPGSMLAKHKAKMVEMKTCLDETKELSAEKSVTEKSRRRCRHMIEDIQHQIKAQGKVASVARKQADKCTSIADQLAEYAEEEREAAIMRKIALDKAVACVEKSGTHGSSVESQLFEAERAALEANDLAVKSRASAEQLAKETEGAKDFIDEKKEVDELKGKKEKAAIALEAATTVKKRADEVAADARRRMNTNRELFDKAKQDSAEEVHRVEVDESTRRNAIASHCKAIELKHQLEEAKRKATAAVSNAADKRMAARHAKEYRDKKVRVKPVSQSLEKLTLIHSTKFRNFEKSLMLPFWHMHSISDAGLLHQVGRGPLGIKEWKEISKNNMTRVFPSKHEHLRSSSRNLNPILPWTMGSQLVSISCQARDDFSFLNDGRFRENGSCGYVLKPEQLVEGIAAADEECPHDEIQIDIPRKLSVKVLSGYNLPKPESGARGIISPRVRVTLFDGASMGNSPPPPVHVTKAAKGNGISPVWNEEDGASFVAIKPCVALVLISVWNARFDMENDDFIAAAAVPVSSLRQGYRSVQLFDSNHSRRGAYGFASLLVKVSTEGNSGAI